MFKVFISYSLGNLLLKTLSSIGVATTLDEEAELPGHVPPEDTLAITCKVGTPQVLGTCMGLP